MTVKPSIYIIYIGVARLKLMFYIIFSRNKSCFVSFNKCPWRTSGQVWPRIISQFYDFLIYWTSWPCVQCKHVQHNLLEGEVSYAISSVRQLSNVNSIMRQIFGANWIAEMFKIKKMQFQCALIIRQILDAIPMCANLSIVIWRCDNPKFLFKVR